MLQKFFNNNNNNKDKSTYLKSNIEVQILNNDTFLKSFLLIKGN